MFNKFRNDVPPATPGTSRDTANNRGGIPVLDASRGQAPAAAATSPSQSKNVSSSQAAVAASSSTAPSPQASAAPSDPAPPLREPAGEAATGARLIVGPEVKLRGAEILDCDTLVVEGRVEATMDSRVIRIAENGSFSGKVSIDIAEIHGSFEGELTARLQLIIHSTGRVSGTIRYGKLVADEGCQLCGDINLLSPSAKPKSNVEPLVGFNTAAG